MEIEYFTDELQEVFECRIEMFMQIEEQPVSRLNNILHFGRDAAEPLDPEDLPVVYDTTFEMARALHLALQSAVLPSLSGDTVLTTVRAKIIHPFIGPFSDFTDSTEGGGTATCDEPNNCMVVQKSTARAGRSHRGRMFVGFLPDDSVSQGLIEKPTAEAILDGMNEWCADGLEAGDSLVRPGVWSRKLAESPGTIEEAFSPIGAFTADLVARSLQSRARPYRFILGNTSV